MEGWSAPEEVPAVVGRGLNGPWEEVAFARRLTLDGRKLDHFDHIDQGVHRKVLI
jgi:hypothetical protein